VTCYFKRSHYNEDLFSIYYLKSDKTMVNSSGFTPPPGLDLTTRTWYQMAIQTDEVIYSPGYLNATEDQIIVTLAYAVRHNEEILGVVGADIVITEIKEYVSTLKIGNTGYAILLDQNDYVLAHPDMQTSQLELLHVSQYSDDLTNLLANRFIQDVKVNDEIGVITHTNARHGDYSIIVFMSNDEYRSSMTFFTTLYIILIFIFIIMEAGLVTINTRLIIEPLVKLVDDIKSINVDVDMTYRLPTSEQTGFTEIRNAVNQVLLKTEEIFDVNKRYYRELTIENQRFLMIVESTTDIIFEIDMDRRFVAVYGKGLTKINKTAKDFIGKQVIDVFGNDGEERNRLYQKVLEGENIFYDWEITIDSDTLYFESSVAPIFSEDRIIIGAVGITRDITEPKKRQAEIKYISEHDFLTGLNNRRYFDETLTKMDNEENYPLNIVMIDLNGLKIINDAFGHEYGDEALKQVANALRTTFRYEDVICRVGGDEFSVIAPRTSVEELENYKMLCREKLDVIRIQNLPISIAYGYDIKRDNQSSIDEVIKLSENNMYRRKLSESNSIRNHAIQAILKTLTDKYKEEKIHSLKVAELCKAIGMKLGIKDENLKELEMAGMYHDIGKISIPDAILNKPGRLTDEEYEIMKTHTEAGYQILKAADQYSHLADYALSHHERWDGKGYPNKIKGEEIPLFSRIIALADSFEAMTADRPYRTKMSKSEAVKEMIRHSGYQFDPKIAKVFVEQVLKSKFD
jgi:diguanylate cyclase (GGDEF)-like protein/PAS domain S-box-containing protein/putative nucleotidyltransferase with HDIG domain